MIVFYCVGTTFTDSTHSWATDPAEISTIQDKATKRNDSILPNVVRRSRDGLCWLRIPYGILENPQLVFDWIQLFDCLLDYTVHDSVLWFLESGNFLEDHGENSNKHQNTYLRRLW